MIWHLLEVWLMMVLVFVVGCLAGAHLYGVVAASRLALVQGAVADAVGDILDRIKARVGLAPAWRPDHLRQIERAHEPELRKELAQRSEVSAEEQPPPLPAAPAAGVAPPARPRRLAFGRPRPTAQLAVPGPVPPPAPAPQVLPMRPAGLSVPRGGVPDNLQRIRGIGKRNEELLNGLGIFHFGQIAAWTPGEAQWIGQYLAFPERIARDDWVGQAILLAMGSETGFQKSAERRRERRRRERDFQSRMTTAGAAYDPGPAGDDEGESGLDAMPRGGANRAGSLPYNDEGESFEPAGLEDDSGEEDASLPLGDAASETRR